MFYFSLECYSEDIEEEALLFGTLCICTMTVTVPVPVTMTVHTMYICTSLRQPHAVPLGQMSAIHLILYVGDSLLGVRFQDSEAILNRV